MGADAMAKVHTITLVEFYLLAGDQRFFDYLPPCCAIYEDLLKNARELVNEYIVTTPDLTPKVNNAGQGFLAVHFGAPLNLILQQVGAVARLDIRSLDRLTALIVEVLRIKADLLLIYYVNEKNQRQVINLAVLT